nr:DUF3265 domain-containing protein [Vibrio diabolicus]
MARGILLYWACSANNLSSIKNLHLTNCLRAIRNAWHFYHALVLVFKVVCGNFGIALLTP